MERLKLIRFMSWAELRKYLRGEIVKGSTDWSKQANTASKGICFFPATPPPEDRLHYLSGNVDFQAVAEFEVIAPVEVTTSWGEYRDPDEPLPDNLWDLVFAPVKRIRVNEYCMPEYSNKILRLLRVGNVGAGKNFEWVINWNIDLTGGAV